MDAYIRYVNEFPKPVETAVETRFKIAEMYKAAHDEALYHKELEEIVRVDAGCRAGKDRPDPDACGTFGTGPRGAALSGDFVAVKLRQPFEASLQDKKQRMDATIEAMGRLVDYEIDEVTAAATYYMAETYFEFQPLTAGVGAAGRLEARGSGKVRERTSMRQRFRSRRKPSTYTRRTWNCCTPASSMRGPRKVSAGSPN